MKKLLVLLLTALSSVSMYSQQLAFPGAEGFGRYAIGGRKGSVYKVTNLNDSGTGSLRDAVSQSNRIIVFDVSGVIKLKSRLVFSSNLTIAGQTAPGEGITVYGNGVSFSGSNNIICRHIRFRMGTSGDSGKDATGIANGHTMIFDHISTSWGLDENFSISWDNKGTEPRDITIQNSIISQGLQTHSCGGLIQTDGGVSLFRNLYIDNKTRNPKVKGLNQFVNNVVYNWGSGGGYILGDSEGTSWATIVNNYFIKGPETGGTQPYTRANNNFQLYATGNYFDGDMDGTLNGTVSAKNDYGPAFWVESPDYWLSSTPAIPQTHPEITVQMTALEAYNWIVDSVGCVLPIRDSVDEYVIDELLSLGKKGKLISSEAELGLPNGVGYVFTANKLTDTDNDGIPDVWEEKLGTDKNTNDAMTIGTDGYANIERYINAIDKPIDYLRYPMDARNIGATQTSITLDWKNLETRATEIVLEISTNGTTFTEQKRLSGNSNTTTVEGLQPATQYYFRLQAVNDNTASLYSNIVSAETYAEITPPSQTENPYPTDKSQIEAYKKVTLSWINDTKSYMGIFFNVYFGKDENNLTKVAEYLAIKSYEVSNLEEETTYYWKIEAINISLETSMSDTWSFTTGKPKEREMIVHFPFNETSGSIATDLISGQQAIAQGVAPSWTEGKCGQAIQLPGQPTASHLKVEHNESLLLNNCSFTISLWFKSNGGTDVYLLHKGSHTKNDQTGATGKWVGIQYKAPNLVFGIDDDIIKSEVKLSASDKFNNTWRHLACVRNIETKKIQMYVDGVKVGEADDNTTTIGEASGLIIGNCNVNFNTPYTGLLDDLRIYNDALDGDEIVDLLNCTSSSISTLSDEGLKTKAYPSPFTGYIDLELGDKLLQASEITVQLFHPEGRLIVRQNLSPNGKTVRLDGLENLSPGVYIYTVVSGEAFETGRIIKK